MPNAPFGTNWEFEGFQVLREKRLLLGGGTPLPLTSKAFDTLVVLITNRGRVVTKDELLTAVWPDVQVEEGNLTQQIFLLRKALGENAQQPRYIVTVPGHGYRFTATVRELSADPVTTRRSTFIAAGIGAVLVIAIGWSWMARDKTSPAWALTNVRVEKVTESGKATCSAISPDGRYVAYVENDGDEYSLWGKKIATEGKTPIVPRQPFVLKDLSFSPDGEYIYFTRGTPRRGGFMLFRIPALGGLEAPILDDVDSPISFSPDGSEFVFMRGAGAETRIVVAAAGGGAQRNLATRQDPIAFGFFAPDWSPDGKVVATSEVDGSKGSQSIVLLPLTGGSDTLYTSDRRLGRVRWLPDGSGLLTIVSEGLDGPHQFARLSGGTILRVGYPDGRAERLTSDLTEHDLCCLDIGANGNVVASVVNTLVSDLWIAPAGQLDARTQITSGHPVITPHSWLGDNDTIVYRDVTGRLNAAHKDTSQFSLPLPDGRKAVGGVSACGDGRYVVFRTVPGNNIWRVAPNAGGAFKLTTGAFDSNPACSADGKSVVYVSRRPDPRSLWQVSIEGGEPTPLLESRNESFDVLPSPRTGRMFYYWTFEWEARPVPTRVARWVVMLFSDRTRLHAFDVPVDSTIGMNPVWAPDESGLDYVVTRNGVSNIWRQPLTGGPAAPITTFRTGQIFSFAWSRDGRWLSLGSGASRSDVVVMSRRP